MTVASRNLGGRSRRMTGLGHSMAGTSRKSTSRDGITPTTRHQQGGSLENNMNRHRSGNLRSTSRHRSGKLGSSGQADTAALGRATTAGGTRGAHGIARRRSDHRRAERPGHQSLCERPWPAPKQWRENQSSLPLHLQRTCRSSRMLGKPRRLHGRRRKSATQKGTMPC